MVEEESYGEGRIMSREAMLARIRSALAVAGEAPDYLPPDSAEWQDAGINLARDVSADESTISLLVHRLEDYDARVFTVEPGDAGAKIADILRASGKNRIVVPPGLFADWMRPGTEWVRDENLSYSEIEGCDGVLTAASVAVAESGSIVLQHGPTEGRRALTLLPDYHLCVVRRSQVVATLPECFARLKSQAPSLITFISGPSATADIEMTRIKGVHGPRFLDVVLLNS